MATSPTYPWTQTTITTPSSTSSSTASPTIFPTTNGLDLTLISPGLAIFLCLMGALIGLLAFKLIHTLLTACFPPLRSQHQQAHEQHQPGQDVWAAIRAAHATAEGDALALAQDQSLNTETATTTATDLGLQDIVPMEEVLETGIGGRTEHARSTDGFGVMEDVGMDGVEEGRGSIEELVRRGQEMARVLQMVGGFTDEELEAERERRRRVMPSWI